MKIPISCDWCGRTVIRITRANPEGQVNYSDKCADCAEPRPALVVLVPTLARHAVRRVA